MNQKGWLIGFTIVPLILGLAMMPVGPAMADATVWDGFTETSLPEFEATWYIVLGTYDTNIHPNQDILDNNGSTHLRVLELWEAQVNSKDTFEPGSFALCRLRMNGAGNRFGFAPTGSNSAYFESVADDTVKAIVNVDDVNVVDESVDISANEFHIFNIYWDPDGNIFFFIDGVEVEDAACSGFSSDPLTVGLWNDGTESCEFDWAFLTCKDVMLLPSAFNLTDGILSAFDPFGVDDYFPFVSPPTNAWVTEFDQVDGLFYARTLHTKATGYEEYPFFMLNQKIADDIVLVPMADPYPFTTPKKKTSMSYIYDWVTDVEGLNGTCEAYHACLGEIDYEPGELHKGRQALHIAWEKGPDAFVHCEIQVGKKK